MADVWGIGVILAVFPLLSSTPGCQALIQLDAETGDRTLHLGVLAPFEEEWQLGRNIVSTIIPAIETVKQLQLLPGYDITWSWRNSGCNPKVGFRAVIDLWEKEEDIDGFIGPACSVVCQPVALLAAAWNIPTISYACTSSSLSDKSVYPTFVRMVGIQEIVAPAPGEILKLIGWERCVIITTPEDLWARGAIEVKKNMESVGFKVFYHVVPSATTNGELDDASMTSQLEMMRVVKSEARYVVLYMYWDDVRLLLLHAYDEGMLQGEYLFFTLLTSHMIYENPLYRPEVPNHELFEGVFVAEPTFPGGPDWDQLRGDVIDAFNHPAFDDITHVENSEYVSNYAGFLHDGVVLWARGVNQTLAAGDAPDNGSTVASNIFDTTSYGISGEIIIDYKGDRKIDHTITIIQPRHTVIEVFVWHSSRVELESLYQSGPVSEWSGLQWPGRTTDFPTGIPPCGWEHEFCASNEKDPTLAIVISVVVAVAVIVAVILVAYNAHMNKLLNQENQEIQNHFIESSSICFTTERDTGAFSRSGHSMMLDAGDRLLHSAADTIREGSVTSQSDHTGSYSRSFYELGIMGKQLEDGVPGLHTLTQTTVATIDGRLRAVRVYQCEGLRASDKGLHAEMRGLLILSHANLNPFVGVSLTPTLVAIITEYASRGSLRDRITAQNTKLQWDFKVSFVSDIIRGLRYLHRSDVKYHGHLTSTNCVVDRRWTCKITDYGFDAIRKREHDRGDIWSAPELLRREGCHGQAADVYAFAIVVFEIMSQEEPYKQNIPELTLDETLEAVKEAQHPPYRPHITTSSCPPGWIQLLTICWQEDPRMRPALDDVRDIVMDIIGGPLPNLVDTMISNMEKHTRKLESVVNERTREVREEKVKMDALLSELLPPSVVKQLEDGAGVKPETFDDVTLFFSDIVGFTKVSAKSTPFEVVTMLNDLYSRLDEILSQHDVYKVATIGDAYMLASGLPTRNGSRHAPEIAATAVKFMNTMDSFVVPHIKDEKLFMRIGIHSGSCVAAVSGIKAPRYMLFGETIDIAARMESGGKPMRIHLSEATATILRQEGTFGVEYRGKMTLPGGQNIETFWLT